MTKWWQRLSRVMTERGISVEDVSASSGIPTKTIYGYLKGEVANPRRDKLAKLAKAVGVSERYLRFGEEKITLKRVPLLDMNKLGTVNISEAILSVWDGVSTVAVPEDVPEDAFGITIIDDANAPNFSPGDIVICSPSAPVQPGRYVLAVRSSGGAYFGRYRKVSEDRFEVVPDDPHWPTIGIGGDQPGFVLARGVKRIQDI